MDRIAESIKFGELEGIGNAGDLRPVGNTFAPYLASAITIPRVLSLVIGIMTIIVFIWFTLKLLMSALTIISAGGDKAKVASAKESMTNSLVGIIVVVSAIFIARLVVEITGIEFLNFTWISTNLIFGF